MKYVFFLIIFFSSTLLGWARMQEDTVFTPDSDVFHSFLTKQFNYKKYRNSLIENDSIYTVAKVKIKGNHISRIDFCCENFKALQEEMIRLIMMTDGKWKDQGVFSIFIPFIGVDEGIVYSPETYKFFLEKIESAKQLEKCMKKKNCHVYQTLLWITFPSLHRKSGNNE